MCFMRFSLMKKAVKLLGYEWDLGKKESGANGNICAWIYLFEILGDSEKIVYYIENKKLIGFCGYSKYNSKKYKLRKTFYRFIKVLLMNSRKIKNKQGIKTYYNNYEYTPKELVNYFDGEISILIVDNSYRGKGIGKKLLLKTFDKARFDNMKNLKILTDESCSYSFYEHLGCQRVFETVIENKEYGKVGETSSEIAYIYEKKL